MQPKKILLLVVCIYAIINCTAAQTIREVKMPELVAFYKQAKGILVVNFWSTWCKPCIDEIPHFISVVNTMKSDRGQLLLVSQDTKDLYTSGQLKKYLQAKKWNVPVVWLNETNADYYCPLVDAAWSGAIPASVIIRPATGYFQFYEESLSKEALQTAIQKAMVAK
jgi:thiol-disulfide isomerase/thioredoxin